MFVPELLPWLVLHDSPHTLKGPSSGSGAQGGYVHAFSQLFQGEEDR